ncbi:MAG: restriction endonuclease subunit S [Nitrososphaerota archaeon]|jgi:type I restriction enzyme S subunit|nr:restriction endonuclease subunit S [Nitrososphaerota archaeon]
MVVPENWSLQEIGHLADIFNGGTPNTNNLSFWNGTVLWVTPSDITEQKTKYLISTERKISHDGMKNSSAVLLPEGTNLLCTRATIGAISIAGTELTTNQGFKNLVCNKLVNNEFLYYALQMLKNEMIAKAIGTTFLELSKNALSKLTVLVPNDTKEQNSIVAVLSDIDCLIMSLEGLIAKKKAIKQGAMQTLLTGKKRLPGFSGEWELSNICSEFDLFACGDLIKEHFSPSQTHKHKYPIYANALQNGGLYGFTSVPRYKGDSITVTGRGDIGVAMYRETDFDAIVRLLVLVPKTINNVNSQFVTDLLNTCIEFPQESTGVPQLTVPQIKNVELRLPPKPEQIAITEVIFNMAVEIEHLEKKVTKYRLVKQGMMQELLTGRIRLLKYEPVIIHTEKTAKKILPGFSEGFKAAVILTVLVNAFGTVEYPFTAFDCQKFPYLLHRHLEGIAKGYTECAAGPYNPDLKYKTARPIALKKGYIRECTGK